VVELNEGVKASLEVLKRRLKTYLKCELAFALTKDGDKYKINYGVIRFLHSKDEMPKEIQYSYNNFVLVRKLVEPNVAEDLINKLINEDNLELPKFGNIEIETNSVNSDGYPQKYIPGFGYFGWAYGQYEWPSIRITYDIKQDKVAKAPIGQLVDYNYPLYPDYLHALADFVQGPIYNPSGNKIEIIIPDFRARIKKVKMLSKNIKAEIECRDAEEKELVAKYYIQNRDNSSATSDNIKIVDGNVIVPYNEPVFIQLNLIHQKDNEDIDNKYISVNNYNLQPWQEIDEVAHKDDIITLIKEGEGEQVERKEKLDEKRFLPSAGAFANTKGGIIALGITDDGQIKGSNDNEDRIKNLILSNFEPPLNFRTRKLDYDGTSLVIVEVAEGDNKPYMLKERGVFTRKGDRNRQITRAELDELFKKKDIHHGGISY